MSNDQPAPKGRPPEIISPIPDTFENVIKALVRPVRPAPDSNEAQKDES